MAMVAVGGAEDEELERIKRRELAKLLRKAGRAGGGVEGEDSHTG
jgi:hypothetical protein